MWYLPEDCNNMKIESVNSVTIIYYIYIVTMERVNFNYSLKNIPIPNNKSYLKTMIDKVEKFI